MIHLRKRVLSLLLHTPSSGSAPRISPLFSLRRLSTATTPIAASPFSAEDYLVANCGLSRAQAAKASKILSHLKYPSKPNAVLAFLAGLGLSTTEVATVVAGDPRFLCADVGIGSIREAAERVEELGIKCGSGMFCRALVLVALMSKDDVSKKIELLHNIGFSPDDALVTVRKAPLVLRLSDEKIRRVMDFLTKDVGLETPYIAQRPALLMYSLEKRLLPRHFLLKVLREKGFLNVELSYYSTAVISEKLFVKKFVLPYKDHVSGLADDYASMCSGKDLYEASVNEI